MSAFCLLVFNTVQFPDVAEFQAVQRQLTQLPHGTGQSLERCVYVCMYICMYVYTFKTFNYVRIHIYAYEMSVIFTQIL